MSKRFIVDKTFQRIDYNASELIKGEYDNCLFEDCVFANTNISDSAFSDCEFKNCDLSLVKLINTSFKDVRFTNCKLLGLHFNECNKFGFEIDFSSCLLNLSSFYKMNLKNLKFINCTLHEVDFTEANLSDLVLENCDLSGALFDNTILEKTDFRSSFSYAIDPEKNRIKKAKFSMSGVIGLLSKYDIVIE